MRRNDIGEPKIDVKLLNQNETTDNEFEQELDQVLFNTNSSRH